jgi:hypothetical protein
MAETCLEPRQHLFSEAIYRINSELENVRALMGQKKPALLQLLQRVSFAPAYFDRRLRGYRYVTVKNENWRWNEALRQECAVVLSEMFAEGEWERNQAVLGSHWPERVRRTETGIYAFAEATHWQAIADGSRFDEEAHRALLALVTGRLFRPGRNIEGLCHRCDAEARAMGARLRFVISEFVTAESPRDAKRLWYRFKDDPPSPPRIFSQRRGAYVDEDVEPAAVATAPHFYHALQNALMRYDESSQLSHMLSIPIYDAGDMADPWGRIAAIVHLNLYTTEDMRPSNEELVELGNLFLAEGDKLPDVIRAVAQAQVVGWPVAGSRSAAGLAAGHFLELQPLFQEWDEVTVHDATALIERWGYEVSDGRAEWKLLEGAPEARGGEDPERVIELDCPGELLRLAWADPRDIKELSALTFRFRLPVEARLPAGEAMRDAVLRQYRQELIDTLRVVLPKVQRHRYAVRTAAIAIMGRNLSHNIGSHVLSSVASFGALDEEGLELDGRKNDLLRYLQERMDFIAELSTTKQYMYLPMPLRDALSRLRAETLLRKYITGVENSVGKPAWLNLVAPAERAAAVAATLISVPSALIGLHAIYVIIENIARNSAKHRRKPIEHEVKLTLDTHPVDDGFVRISVWDDAREATPALVEQINACIEDGKVVDDTGGIGEGNWGLREMCAAAAYLRGADIADIDGVGCAPPLLQAFATEGDNGSAGSLGYHFYATVPKILVTVDDSRGQQPAWPGVDRWRESDPRWLGRLPHAYAFISGNIEAEVERRGTAHRLPVRRTPTDEAPESGADEMELWELASARWLRRMLVRHSRAVETPLPIATTPRAKRGLGTPVDQLKLDSNCLVFDHHMTDFIDQADANAALFYEYYDATFDQSSLIDKAPATGKRALENELRAAAIARIAIIDERLQEIAASRVSLPGFYPARSKALEKQRIDVPTWAQVGPLRRNPEPDRIEAYLADIHKKDKIDFLLVHQGILDRIGKPEGGIEWVGRFAREALDGAEVVVCSGRGAPSQAVGKVRFAPLSAVMRWTVVKPSKYHLHDLLCASRSPSHV